jgi:hypothetical protein
LLYKFHVFRLFFAPFAVHCVLCDTAVLLELKQYRKERNEPQGTQREKTSM